VTKASEIIGRAVAIREGGQHVGKVRDLVIDQYGKQVLGFVISEGMFKSTRVAPWGGVQTIGPDSVILGTTGAVVKAVDVPDIKSILDKNLRIRGVKLQTTAGKDLGEIDDLEFDDRTGAVLGYQLSGGLFADAFGGHSFLPTPMSIELGKDLAFVGPEAEATIGERGDGLKGALKRDDEQ
jgi:uncharacterized protein YrrD